MIGKRPNDHGPRFPEEIIATLPGLLSARALAIAARLYHMRDRLDYDECRHFLVVRATFRARVRSRGHHASHPPFYHPAIKPFAEFSTSSFWLKLPSLVSGPPSVLLADAGLSRLGSLGVERGREETGTA